MNRDDLIKAFADIERLAHIGTCFPTTANLRRIKRICDHIIKDGVKP